MACLMLGKRKDTGPGHNMVLTFIGASLLWVGWFGFNAGSAVTAGMQAGMAMTVTHMATAFAGFTWMPRRVDDARQAHGDRHLQPARSRASSPSRRLRASSVRSAEPASASRPASSATGACTGLKHMFGYDDALDAFGVHASAALVGALLTGVFAIELIRRHRRPARRHAMQVVNQAEGIVIVFVYDAIVSLIILKIIDIFIGLRVTRRGGARRPRPRACTARPCTRRFPAAARGQLPDRDTVRVETRHRPCRRGAPSASRGPSLFCGDRLIMLES